MNILHSAYWICSLMVLGLLSDVFDGIIARKLELSTEKLRIWDSNVDQVFWLSLLGTTIYLFPTNYQKISTPLLILLASEGLCYIISWLKFKKTIATHSLLAKAWTLSILCFLGELLLFQTTHTFYTCFILGMISRTEILGIILLLKEWTTDVPSILFVKKINRGEQIPKNKLFNS